MSAHVFRFRGLFAIYPAQGCAYFRIRRDRWSYPEIGQALGVSHHAVMYACDPYYRNRKRRLNTARNVAKRERAAMVVGRGRGL